MKKFINICLILSIATVSFSQKNAEQESINKFSFKIFEQLYIKGDNCFFSPYSIFGALSMTYAGAADNTKTDMEKTLGITDNTIVHSGFKEITNSIMQNKEIQFLSSNSLWLQKNFKLEKEYTKLVEENYLAKCKNVDFKDETDREKGRKEINTWVDKQTKGNITDFIKPGILSESTAMVLIKAVYFKAIWQSEFSPQNTKNAKFLAVIGDSIDCKMMNNELKTNYFEDNLAQVIEIPYESNKSSMIVILPKDSAKSDLKQFGSAYLNKFYQHLELVDVNLSLPSFKMEVEYELSDALKKMGMKSAFDPGANFSGITGQKDLIVTNVLHKSIIDVSEKGTEASSTTAVISMRSTSINKKPIVFKADHPFIFFIKDRGTGVIIFMGYLAQPK